MMIDREMSDDEMQGGLVRGIREVWMDGMKDDDGMTISHERKWVIRLGTAGSERKELGLLGNIGRGKGSWRSWNFTFLSLVSRC